MNWNVAIITISDQNTKGQREDTSAQVVTELIEEEIGGAIIEGRIVPNEMNEIMAALIEICDYYRAHIVFTIGGSGITKKDVTPEATNQVIEKIVPGISERMRTHPSHMFFRGISGMRNRTLIINLPDRPKGVAETLSLVLDDLPQGLIQLAEE